MTVIKVPAVNMKSSFDPSRPVSSLLKMQMEHLYAAEQRLPTRYHSQIYVNAIRTEGEAANYIRVMTEAIVAAHADAAARREKPAPKRKRVIEIAAVADERAQSKRKRKVSKSPRKIRKKK
jgi:hypothetical protein